MKYTPLGCKEKLTKKILHNLYINKNLSSETIGAHFNCSSSTILNYLKRYHIPRRKPNYNGGIKYSSGYKCIRLPKHPRASNGYVPEQILIMEKHLKRPLKIISLNNSKNEVIHHIDGNKLNNKISNLQLMTFGEHIALHNKIKNKIRKYRRDKYGRFYGPNYKTPPTSCKNCGQILSKSKKHQCEKRLKDGKYKCGKCNKFKKISEFYKDKHKKYGFCKICKDCNSKQRKKLRRKHGRKSRQRK